DAGRRATLDQLFYRAFITSAFVALKIFVGLSPRHAPASATRAVVAEEHFEVGPACRGERLERECHPKVPLRRGLVTSPLRLHRCGWHCEVSAAKVLAFRFPPGRAGEIRRKLHRESFDPAA